MMSSTDRPVGFPIRAPRCLQPTYTRASMNRGQLETAKLRQNAEEQVARLMTQLEDLDAMRDVRGWSPCAIHTRRLYERGLTHLSAPHATHRTWRRKSMRARGRRR